MQDQGKETPAMGSSAIPVILALVVIGVSMFVIGQRRRKPPGGHDTGRIAWNQPRFWKVAGCLLLSAGLTVPLAAAAPARPAPTVSTASTASASTSRITASASTSRHGYIPISGRVKLAYDLTLPAPAGQFPVALEYNDYTAGTDNTAGICESGQPLTMMVNLLRHYVAGADNGWQKTPQITILHQVSAAASKPAWTSTYNSWSTVVKPVTLYFRADGSLAAHPATAGGTSSFSGPAPSQSGSWTAVPRHGSSVSYTTPPLARDADFFGPASVNLWLSSLLGPRAGEPTLPDAPDTDIEVIISEVRPDGQEQYVQAGWLDVAQRKLAPAGLGARQSSPLRPYQAHTQASYQPLSPRTPVYARVELFPFEHVFRAGSSIRITIDSAMGAVQSTGYWGLAGLPAPFQDTVYATPAQQSQVVLGLIPGAAAQAPLPACNTIAGEPCRPNAVPVPPGRLVMP
jgi:X-Pro dipeptidyl-peptidase C-terminal non-catalytic domain